MFPLGSHPRGVNLLKMYPPVVEKSWSMLPILIFHDVSNGETGTIGSKIAKDRHDLDEDFAVGTSI